MAKHDWADVYAKAVKAGEAAYAAATPTPMVVGDAKGITSNEIDYTKPTYYVADGVCGFAWVEVHPARGGFVTWCKKNGHGRKGYPAGYHFWVKTPCQSYERKRAYAGAFAKVLTDHGIKAYAMSRLD